MTALIFIASAGLTSICISLMIVNQNLYRIAKAVQNLQHLNRK